MVLTVELCPAVRPIERCALAEETHQDEKAAWAVSQVETAY